MVPSGFSTRRAIWKSLKPRRLASCKHIAGEVFDFVVGAELVAVVDDIFQALYKPAVDLGKVGDALYGIALFERLGYGEYAKVGGVGEGLLQVVEPDVVVADKSVHALAYHAQTLLYDFFK